VSWPSAGAGAGAVCRCTGAVDGRGPGVMAIGGVPLSAFVSPSAGAGAGAEVGGVCPCTAAVGAGGPGSLAAAGVAASLPEAGEGGVGTRVGRVRRWTGAVEDFVR
jgi:hypothetical protein